MFKIFITSLLIGTFSLSAMNQPTKCNIKGLDKADVIKALFYAAQGDYSVADLDEEIKYVLPKAFVDYVGGRSIKLYIEEENGTFDTYLYNRDNGAGAAEKAIDELRGKKDTIIDEQKQKVADKPKIIDKFKKILTRNEKK